MVALVMVAQDEGLVPWVEPVTPECKPPFPVFTGLMPVPELEETPQRAKAGPDPPMAAAAKIAAKTAPDVAARMEALVRMMYLLTPLWRETAKRTFSDVVSRLVDVNRVE